MMGEILLILFIAFIVIDPKKWPAAAQNIGKGLRFFRHYQQGLMNDIKKEWKNHDNDAS